jgi:hypothetical protein
VKLLELVRLLNEELEAREKETNETRNKCYTLTAAAQNKPEPESP